MVAKCMMKRSRTSSKTSGWTKEEKAMQNYKWRRKSSNGKGKKKKGKERKKAEKRPAVYIRMRTGRGRRRGEEGRRGNGPKRSAAPTFFKGLVLQSAGSSSLGGTAGSLGWGGAEKVGELERKGKRCPLSRSVLGPHELPSATKLRKVTSPKTDICNIWNYAPPELGL